MRASPILCLRNLDSASLPADIDTEGQPANGHFRIITGADEFLHRFRGLVAFEHSELMLRWSGKI